MIGYKVLTRSGLKGPYQKSSIIKAITSAMLPLQARLLDLQTGQYVSAAELVGEMPEAVSVSAPAPVASDTLKPITPLRTRSPLRRMPGRAKTLPQHPRALPKLEPEAQAPALAPEFEDSNELTLEV